MKPRVEKALLVGVGMGVLAADILNREARRLIKEYRLSKPAARRAAKQAVKVARAHARQLEKRMAALHKEYRAKALNLAGECTEEALKRVHESVKAQRPRSRR